MYTNSYPAREISRAGLEQNIENLKREREAFLEPLKGTLHIPGKTDHALQTARNTLRDIDLNMLAFGWANRPR